MSFIKRFWISALMLFIFLPGAWACSLPAEPCSAIVPVNSGNADMELVEEGNSFFYLVPQNSSAQFKLVWDPAAHNSGTIQTDKYEWCTKAEIAFEPETDQPNGYGYFPAGAMKEFFEVSGNRSSIIEAFNRTTGVSTEDAFITGILGPYMTLSGFVQPGQDGEVTTLGTGDAYEYPDTGRYPTTPLDSEPVTEAIDNGFAHSRFNVASFPTNYEWTDYEWGSPSGDSKAIHIHGEGLLIEDIEIDVTDIELEDYKAYVLTGNDATNIHFESSPSLPRTSDGREGTSGGGADNTDFNITFTTPTFDGNKANSKIKLKVWAPGAGFEISNIYWVWKEDVYNKVTEDRVIQEAVYNASGTLIQPEVRKEKDYYEFDKTLNCSQEIMLKVIKPAADAGTTDFIVYDSKGPISSEFTLNPTEPQFEPTGPTTFDFNLTVLDTNPYFDQSFNETFEFADGSRTLNQSKDNLGMKVFYSYPCYDYSEVTGKSINNIKSDVDGYGLIERENPEDNSPTFKSYKYEPKWVWHEADVDVETVSSDQKHSADELVAGSLSTITGKITINNPRPWHQCNDSSSSEGTSDPMPVFKILTVSKDTAGLPCELYEGIATIETPLESDIAEPGATPSTGKNPAVDPRDGYSIDAGEQSDIIENPVIQTGHWSNLVYMNSKDETAPELQVIVFDTRTNKYHLFGSKQHVDASFMASYPSALDYSDLDVPYLGKGAQIDSSYEFSDFDNISELYTKFINDEEPAVSTVEENSKTAYVCQKNTRLVFYIRAFDNIKTFTSTADFGISDLKYSITDHPNSPNSVADTSVDNLEPVEHVFRFANVDADGNVSPEYELKATATDHSGNSRDLILKIGVMGRELNIRTLEERRKRIE
ncbi:MAG: hypothetical protein ACQETH_12195 [Candidatus Rifleibacteriota bacterium]